MKRLRIGALIIGLGLGLAFQMSRPVDSRAPTIRDFPPFNGNTAYAGAMEDIRMGRTQQGVSALLSLAQANPDSTLGATSLLAAAAEVKTDSESIALYNRIVAEYPRSRFEIQARQGIVLLQAHSPAKWLSDSEALAASYGAPTSAEIVANPSQAGAKFRALPLEYQRAFIQHYEFLGTNLSVQQRYQDSAMVVIFGMDVTSTIAPSAAAHFKNELNFLITDKFNDWRNPVHPGFGEISWRLLHPRGDGSVGPRPRVRVELRQLLALSPLIDLQHASFQLDGRDVSGDVVVLKHKVNFLTRRNKEIFEKIRLGYRPSVPLSPGQHRFDGFVAQSGWKSGPGAVRFTILLDVRKKRDDDDDVERHDFDEWDD